MEHPCCQGWTTATESWPVFCQPANLTAYTSAIMPSITVCPRMHRVWTMCHNVQLPPWIQPTNLSLTRPAFIIDVNVCDMAIDVCWLHVSCYNHIILECVASWLYHPLPLLLFQWQSKLTFSTIFLIRPAVAHPGYTLITMFTDNITWHCMSVTYANLILALQRCW